MIYPQNNETHVSLEAISGAPLRFYKEKSKFSSIQFFIPLTNIYQTGQQKALYNNEFDLPIFDQKKIECLKLFIDRNVDTQSSAINWHISALQAFTFKKLQIFATTISNHLKRVFDLQPGIEEVDIYYQNSFELRTISDFLACQDPIKNLKSLSISLLPLYSTQLNFLKIIPRFVSENMEGLESLYLVSDVKTMNYTIRQILLGNKKQILSDKLKEITLNFQPLQLNQQDQFFSEEENQKDDNFLVNFFNRFEKLTKIRIYFAQTLYNEAVYNQLIQIMQKQADVNQLEHLTLCLSYSRFSFDILPLMQSVKALTHLKKLEIKLDFSTQAYFSKPDEIINLDSVEELILSLQYSPCSHHLIEYISCKNLKSLIVNFSYNMNAEIQVQNLNNLALLINESQNLEEIQIFLLSSFVPNSAFPSILMEAIHAKEKELKQFRFIGMPNSLLNQSTFEVFRRIDQCDIKFENDYSIIVKNNSLNVKTYRSLDTARMSFRFLQSLLNITQERVQIMNLSLNDLDFEENTHFTDNEKVELVFRLIQKNTSVHSLSLSFNLQTLPDKSGSIVIDYLANSTYTKSFNFGSNNYNNPLTLQHVDTLKELVSKRLEISNFSLNNTHPSFIKQICLNRSKEFKRIMRSILAYKQKNIMKLFRTEVINELLEFSYYSPEI